MSEKSRWNSSTIPRHHIQESPGPFKLRKVLILVVPRHHTQELPSPFKLRKVLILVLGFWQMRMRLSPSEDSFNSLKAFFLWFNRNKYACVLKQYELL